MRRFRPREWWRASQACALAFVVLLVAAGGAKVAIAAATGSTFRDVEPLHLFRYTYVARHGDNYTVGITPFLWQPGQELTVPVITLGENATTADVPLVFDAAHRMECAVTYNWYTAPLWHVSRVGGRLFVEVHPARSAATTLGEGGFGLRFEYEGGVFVDAGLLVGPGAEPLAERELTALAHCP